MVYDSILQTSPHISTAGMEYEEWLKKRSDSIGGSDAGAVMGMNSFASPLTVYLQKKGLAPERETSRAAQRGKILEPVIRQRTIEKFPALQIKPVPFIFHHAVYPFMSANIDGAIGAAEAVNIRGQDVQGLGGHEIKSAKTAYGWGDDEIPDSYCCQVQHYMAVPGLPWFMVSVCILDGDEIHHYIIRRNEAFVEKLIAVEKDFWENYVEPGIMPAAIGIENEDDMITGMFAGSQGTIRLGGREKDLCAEYVSINRSIKELETRKHAIASMVKQSIIETAKENISEKKACAVAGPYSVSWTFYSRTSVDTDALKKAGLYEQYSKTTEADRFAISEQKGAAQWQ